MELLGKAADLGEVAPSLQARNGNDPKEGIATNALYDQLKRFFDGRSRVLESLQDVKAA